jgi:hypothetical protein
LAETKDFESVSILSDTTNKQLSLKRIFKTALWHWIQINLVAKGELVHSLSINLSVGQVVVNTVCKFTNEPLAGGIYNSVELDENKVPAMMDE